MRMDMSMDISAGAGIALTPDHCMIRDSAAQFLAEASSSVAVRRAMASGDGIDHALWWRISAELGWCATAIPERHGGLDLGTPELALLMEQMGRRLTCAPFFSTVCLAAGVLMAAAESDVTGNYLAQIAAGDLTASLPLGVDTTNWLAGPDGVVAVADGGDYILNGSFRHVPDGASVQLLLIPARRIGDASPALFAVPQAAAGLTSLAHVTLDATRRLAQVQLDNVRVPPAALIAGGEMAARALRQTTTQAMILLAAEQLGGAQQCLDMTVDYVSQRVQFGRTIASFQAVKHRCAEMMVRVEAARSAVYGAAQVMANAMAKTTGLPVAQLELEAACAKTFASDAFFFCAQEAIQLHGGAGFTWEYDPHLYFKRAQAGSHWLGHPDQLREQVAASLLD